MQQQPSPSPRAREPKRHPTRPAVEPPLTLSRPRRATKAPTRFGYDGSQAGGYLAFPELREAQSLYSQVGPWACKAAKSDPDLFDWNEALSGPDREKWIEAIQTEIDALISNGTWEECDKREATSRIIPGTWVLKVKRTPDGEIRKFKARYCIRGDLEEDSGDRSSPVCNWGSLRLILAVSVMFDWVTANIDFTNAFVQADMDRPTWIHMPRGFRSTNGPNTCLRLLKSLYGTSRGPRLWFEFLSRGLRKLGLKPSDNDPCVWTRTGLIVAFWVDDAALCAPDQKTIDKFVSDLIEEGFNLTVEGTLTEFLGIKLERNRENGTMTMTQRGLINKVLETTGLKDCNPNHTAASTTPLGKDPEGAPMSESWSYPSVVGMLLYLSSNTRPDIAFAVAQVARFNHNPKKSHAQAVKTIVRYLKGTADRGTILKPTQKLHVDLWVDADFAGLFRVEANTDPTSAKSRSGNLVTLGGCPVVCRSFLQSEISLSTCEAETSSLVSGMKMLLPLMRLLLELVERMDLPSSVRSEIQFQVHEDNAAAYQLATEQRLTSRTRYFHTKWWWFWQFIYPRGKIVVVRCPTKEQRADMLTKGQPREVFEANRKLVMGW